MMLILCTIILPTNLQKAEAVTITQLGILIDESASIGPANFNVLKTGICNSLMNQVPLGLVEVTIMKFGGDGDLIQEPSDTTLVFGPTLIVDATDKNNMLTACNNMVFVAGQQTCMSCGINDITALMTIPPRNFASNVAVIDILTDGSPDSKAQTNNARNSAIAAGIDGMSAIGIIANIPFLTTLVFPTPGVVINPPNLILPNPLVQGFVISVQSFNEVEAALSAKLLVEIQNQIGGLLLPVNTHALLIAGIFSNALWIIPVSVGGIGTAIFLKKTNFLKTNLQK